MNKFTFKTNKSSAYDPDFIDVKISRKAVGYIVDVAPFKINLKVKRDDTTSNCRWKWITLKATFTYLQEAKDFLNKHAKNITSKYNLYFDD